MKGTRFAYQNTDVALRREVGNRAIVLSYMTYNEHTTMARSRLLSFLSLGTLSAVGLLLPNASHAAGVVGVFKPIIAQSGQCICFGLAPSWGCILETLQNAINVGISVGIIICVLYLAYAGALFIMSSANPGLREQGKTRLANGVIGMLVILGAWVTVDFIMKTLYDPTTAFSGENFGPWNSILKSNGDDYCIKEQDPVALTSGSWSIVTGAPGTMTSSVAGGVGVAKGLCSDSNTSCSVKVMQAEGITTAQAQAMSCIAVTESAGGANKGNSGTGAQGLFQITGTNWSNPKFHSGNCSAATSRLNDACNRQAAVLMFKNQGYQPWTGMCHSSGGCGNVRNGQYWNPNAVACVAKYDPH